MNTIADDPLAAVHAYADAFNRGDLTAMATTSSPRD